MKKLNTKICLICFMFMFTVVGVSAYSYSSTYGGATGNDINWSWWTGLNINGDYTEAVASNRAGHAAYMKRAYAWSGSEGSWSDWKRSGDEEARVKDYGPFNTSQYGAYGYWDYDQ